MKLLTIIMMFGVLTNLYGQTTPCFYGQSSPCLDLVLKKEFSEKSRTDGRWVYYSDKADIKKIQKSLVKAVLPDYDFYIVTLTNYLGSHVNKGTCVVLFDSLKSNVVLVKPIWFSGVSEQLIRLVLNKRFDNEERMLSFLNELNELMEIGSGYKFVNTSSTGDIIKYDLVYFKGDTYTTGGNGASSTVHYTQDGVLRQIEIKIRDFRMVEYTSINPRLKDVKGYEKDYKEIIK